MQVLHGSWLDSEYTDEDSGFALWAETSEERPARKSGRSSAKRAKPHPFALSTETLRRAWLELLPSADDILLKSSAKGSIAVVQLPSTSHGPQASPGLLREAEEGRGQSTLRMRLSPWQVDALIVSPVDVPGFLLGLPSEDDTTPGIKLGADLRFWSLAARLALELLARQRYAPVLLKQDNRCLAVWQPQLSDPADEARLNQLAEAMPPICRAVARPRDRREPLAPRALLQNLLSIVVDAFARFHVEYGRYLPDAYSTTADAWLVALWNENPVIEESDANLAAFYEQCRAWAEPVLSMAGGDTVRICFRLDPPPTDEDGQDILCPKPKPRIGRCAIFCKPPTIPVCSCPPSKCGVSVAARSNF